MDLIAAHTPAFSPRPQAVPPPFPLELLEDQSPLYRQLTSYLMERFYQLVPKPLPDLYDYPLDLRSHLGRPDQHATVDLKVFTKNRFWSETPPSFPFPEYMQRISESMPKLETTVLLAIPIYAARLEWIYRESLREGIYPPHGLRLGLNMLHRFTIAAVCLASKALGDQFYSNEYCSAVGGISRRELHGLELELSARLGWELQISNDEYAWSWKQLEKFKTG